MDIIYDVSSSDVPRLEENPNVKIVSGPGYKFSYITMNMEMAPYDDIRVREALVLSLDMASIVKTVYGDSAELADSLMAPTVFGYSKIVPTPMTPRRPRNCWQRLVMLTVLRSQSCLTRTAILST